MSFEAQAINRGRERAREQLKHLGAFDYTAPAELFPTRSNKKTRGHVTYKRFDTAAEAIRFAVEDLPPSALLGAYIEVDAARLGQHEIHCLYENAAYPLARRKIVRPSIGAIGI